MTTSTPVPKPHARPPKAGAVAEDRRTARRRRRRVGLLAPTLLGLSVGLLPIALTTSATPASAEPPSILGASELHLSSWGGYDGATPDCNSRNISGDGAVNTQWKITSSIGSGSKVLPGTEWDLIAVLDGHTYQSFYNDGPDPLILEMIPDGPADRVSFHPSVGTSDLDTETPYHGDGAVGPDHAIGDWGYSFDSNSSPKLDGIVQEYSDAVDVTLRIHLRATGPGEITLPELTVSGWDSTPIADDVACSVGLDWSWTVLAPAPPMVAGESVRTDASYAVPLTDDDANGGGHGIEVDVLANDDDPNTAGGIGDHDDVRLSSWSVSSVHGGSVDCGSYVPFPEEEDFPDLAVGPCRYDPPQGFSGTDSFDYTVRQGTDQADTEGTVTIKVRRNVAPTAADDAFVIAETSDASWSVADQIGDLDGDPVECLPELPSAPTPALGSVAMHDDCTFDWDNTAPGETGNVAFTYRVCDTHPLLDDGAHGEAATKTANYNTGIPADLSATTSRRCTDADVTIAVLDGLQIPPKAVKDIETVDAGYSGDAVGPFTVEIPVFSNDFDGNGPKPMEIGIVDGPEPSEGIAEVKGTTHIRFTPADGFAGAVSFTYRNCEDPTEQDPPYAGLPLCGIGTVQIEVLPNEAPVANNDAAALLPGEKLSALDLAANDVEPDGEALLCGPDAQVDAPEEVDSIELTDDCVLDLTPAAGATGPLTVTYEVCDDHHLTSPFHPALPYGADGRFPNGLAARCSNATVAIDLVDPDAGNDDEPQGPVGEGPTDDDPDGGAPGDHGSQGDPSGDPTGDSTGDAGTNGSGKADGSAGAGAVASGTLPLTGGDSDLLATLGAALVAAGLILRRAARSGAR